MSQDPMKEYEDSMRRREQMERSKPDPSMLRFIIDMLRSPAQSLRHGVQPHPQLQPQDLQANPQTPPQPGLVEAYHNRMR